MKRRLTPIITILLGLGLFMLVALPSLMLFGRTTADEPVDLVITGVARPDGSGGYVFEARVAEATYPSATPTPESTAAPSTTPEPTAAPSLVPTQETTPPPTPVPGDGKTCELKVAIPALRIRENPSTNSTAVLPSLGQGDVITADAFEESTAYVWAHHDRGWSAVYNLTADEWWVDGVTGNTEVCQDVQGWPEGLDPPEPIVRDVRAGPHLLLGAKMGWASARYGAWGTLKATNDTEPMLVAYKRANPAGVAVYRSYLNVYYGERDCSPGTSYQAMSTWLGGLVPLWAKTQGHADYFEFQNECDHYSAQQQIDANINAMRWANDHGYCLLLFSHGPGNPTLSQWLEEAPPVLRYALDNPCGQWPDGRVKYHQVALHYYSIDQPLMDYYLFERYRWQYERLDPALWAIGVYFTEWGVDTGHVYDHPDGVDCAKLEEALTRALPFYRADGLGVVRGLHVWSFGGVGAWPDATRCRLW